MNVRDMWAAKLAGGPMPAAKAAPTRIGGLGTGAGAGAAATFSLQRAPFVGAVLGIDPSLRGTGLALIEFAPSRQPVLLRCRTLKIPSSRPMSYALGEIHKAVAAFWVDLQVRL